MKNDIYQERYLAHQARKKDMFTSSYGSKKFKKYTKEEQKTFEQILKNRRSQRAFNRDEVDVEKILELADYRPSSCDRRAIDIKVLSSRDDKDLLSGILVGGVGWCHRADKILLLLANEPAYKSPAEKGIMWYIDAGVLVQNIYLICESMNVGACYINPNIRDENQKFFRERFMDSEGHIFCGAMAIGGYDLKHTK